jgi:peptidyl-prolyl cis-trans isomerase D
MLDLFRQRGLSSAVYGIVIVATIFVFVIQFRPDSTSKTASLKEACVVSVRGWCVDPKDYRSSYHLLMPRDQEGTPSPSRARSMGLPQITLDGLVERELLFDEAERIGLRVVDDEITDQIYQGWIRVSIPAADPRVAAKIRLRDGELYAGFKDQKTKQFDMKVYERQIRNLVGRSPNEFREEQGREILAAKMRDLVTAPVRVSDSEAQDMYIEQKSSATVRSIDVKESWVARWMGAPSPADVTAWAKDPANATEVDTQEKAREADDLPHAGHYRHILVKLAPNPSEDDLRNAAVKLAVAQARIRAGETFAEVAREMSDDKGSALRGGELGDKTDGFVAPFRDAANALSPGQTTATAIQSPFGLHLIMKEDPADEAAVKAQLPKDVARSLYVKAKALEKTETLAKKLLSDVSGGMTVDDAITALVASFPKPAARPAPMAITRLPKPELDGGAADATTSSATPAPAPSKSAATKPAAEGPGDDPERPQALESTSFNKGGDPIAGLANDAQRQVVDFAFSAKEGTWRKDPIRSSDGFLVVSLTDQKMATAEDFSKEKDTFVQTLLAAKKAEALSLHVKRLRDEAKDEIKIDQTYIAELRGDGGVGEDDDEEAP